ncbi:sigma-54 interaction domain-containing protein [Desulfosediminicola sp.]|uniref:sigma-54 interaction domain-containing protein n=1 Tax=Desulfosediminicola sp. TaxID=2886825 RepID=UPI003AF2DCAE
MIEKKYEVDDFKEKYGHLFGHLDSIFNVLHEGVCVSNAEGVIIKMNPMYERLSGLAPEALLGKKVSYLNSKDGVFDEAEPNAEQVEKQEGIFMGAVSPLILKSKRPANSIQTTTGGRKNLLHGYPLLSSEGEIELIITFIRDISHLTLFKEQMATHKDILSAFQSTSSNVYTDQQADPSLIIESPKMKKVLGQVDKIGKTDATVLILGATGVGKGVVARQIHSRSKRADKVFFYADCTTIPDSLVESELFGYAPGAFSGANREGKKGYFEMANNGTIFLDEIGELSPPMQAKLLRVIEDQEIMQVGSNSPKKVNVRIIAATNVDLEDAVAKGNFRQDLYYRLHVSVVKIPQLRDRVEDILPLVSRFVQSYNSKYKKKIAFSEQALILFLNHSWPGNVRELQNLVQGIIIAHETDVVEPEDLPTLLGRENIRSSCRKSVLTQATHSGQSLKDIVNAFEYEILQHAMLEHGSMTKVAKLFKLNRSTVSRKLQGGKN